MTLAKKKTSDISQQKFNDMKAIVKSSGKIVEVSMECNNSTDYRNAIFRTKDGMCYRYNEIELTFDKIKARVKSTGDIFEVSDTTTIYPEHYDKSYNITEVEFLDVKEDAFPKDDTSDYWTRLEHQAAIAAMQGMLNNSYLAGEFRKDPNNGIADMSKIITKAAAVYAHNLVDKYKKEEK